MRPNCSGRGRANRRLTLISCWGDGACRSHSDIWSDPGGSPFPSGSAFLTLPWGIHWTVAVSVSNSRRTNPARTVSPLRSPRTFAAWIVRKSSFGSMTVHWSSSSSAGSNRKRFSRAEKKYEEHCWLFHCRQIWNSFVGTLCSSLNRGSASVSQTICRIHDFSGISILIVVFITNSFEKN